MVYHHTCMLTTPRCTARACSPGEVGTLSSQVMQCTSSVADWMKSNRLQLNADKTEVMWCSTCRQQHQLPSSPMNVNGVSVVPVQSVRDLAIIYIDADLVMRTHVQKTVSRCFAVIRQLCHSVSDRNLAALVTAVVLSVTTGLRECRVGRPSGLPDSSSSVCYERLSTDDPPTTQLRPQNRRTVNLHWLRIPERIQFKVAVLVYKVLHGLAPQYLGPLTRVSNLSGRRHCIRPARISCTYRLFDCRLSAVGHSTLLTREFGTVCQLM